MDYNLDLRFLVKLKKQISMIMADLSWGHITIFRRDIRSLRSHLKELLNILQNVSSCSRYTTFLLFREVAFIDKTYLYSNAFAQIYALTLALMRMSGKTRFRL